jgi:hypothetical protein
VPGPRSSSSRKRRDGYRSVLQRADRIDVELDGGVCNRIGGPAPEVPHDIARLVVEVEMAAPESERLLVTWKPMRSEAETGRRPT